MHWMKANNGVVMDWILLKNDNICTLFNNDVVVYNNICSWTA